MPPRPATKKARIKKIPFAVQAVIFDMDGVITNTMPDHFRAWRRVLNNEGVRVSPFEVYLREGQQGLPSLLEIFAEKKIPIEMARARRLLRAKEELFKKIVGTRFIPGARNFLKDLFKRNFRLALVTGTSRHELKKILPEPLLGLFAVVITGNDVVNGKPNPEPYRKALRRLGITPSQAVVIENAPCGIQSARAAGLRCLAVETSLPRKYLSGAEHIFSSISDLRRRTDFIRPTG